MKINLAGKLMMTVMLFGLLTTFNVAKGAAFSTPTLVGETTIAINQQNHPTKLFAQSANGGFISAITPKTVKEPVAHYLVKGEILYVTGFKPGTMTVSLEETLPSGKKVLSAPYVLTFYQLNLKTQTACESYDPTTRTLAVSPVSPLSLILDITPNGARPQLSAALQNPSLGDIQITYDAAGKAWLQVVFKNEGSTTLTVYNAQSIALITVAIDFLPTKVVALNLYHVMDSKGNRSFKLDQQAMIGHLQTAEKILNQAGVTLTLNDQQDVYVQANLGSTIDAYSEGQSAEEQAVLAATPTSRIQQNTVSVFLVWDYQIQNENTIGINYSDATLGQVIFLSEKSHRPGETLAHEIGHALGLTHNVQGSSYLMSPAETASGEQCLITRTERLTLNPIRI
jgi:hypothetical protein